jgi:UDP-glucose:(heptosyl)LPS alpha-1,3-glucosyltransferase
MPSVAILRQRYSPYGGGEEIIRQAADLLAREGLAEICVVTREWSDRQSPGVRTLVCDPPHVGRLMREVTFCRQSLPLARRHCQLVQSHERIPGADIYRAGDGVYRRWIENYSRVLPPWRRWSLQASPFHRLAMAYERAIYASPQLRAIIANSQMVADDIVAFFPHVRHKVRVIWNGVDCDRFHPGLRDAHRSEVLQRHGLSPHSRVALFLGSGWVRKGLSTAIAAMAGTPPHCHLLVVGRDRRQSMFVDLAARLGVSARVIFAGARHDPASYIGCADALVLPSIYDPMPNSCLEALAAGVPVVASSHTGARDLLVAGSCGLVRDPFMPADWPSALVEALSDEARDTMGCAGRRVALQYSLQRMVSAWMDLYRELLASPKP